MRTRPIHSRNDLIECIRGRGRVTACNRAIDSGIVTVLGGFTPSQGIPVSYWTVLVRSRYRSKWTLAVYMDGGEVLVKELMHGADWLHWAGDATGPFGIYNGDDPAYCYYQHMLALEAKETRDDSTTTD